MAIQSRASNICVKIKRIHETYSWGSHPENKIFTKPLSRILNRTKVVADESYSHVTCTIKTSFRNNLVQLREYRKISARHEIVNRLFNRLYVFTHRFRHSLSILQKRFFAMYNVMGLQLNHFTCHVHWAMINVNHLYSFFFFAFRVTENLLHFKSTMFCVSLSFEDPH